MRRRPTPEPRGPYLLRFFSACFHLSVVESSDSAVLGNSKVPDGGASESTLGTLGFRVNMSERVWDRSLLVTASTVAIASSISIGLAWQTSSHLAAHFSVGAAAPVVVAATVSYALRMLRFRYFLSRSGVALSLRGTMVVQAVGFALSVTPGHVGEVFKLHLIRERAGTPVVQTAPLLLLDRLTEGGGFAILAAASGLLLSTLPTPTPVPGLTLLGLALIFVFALTRRRWAGFLRADASWRQSRLGERLAPHLQNLARGLDVSFTPAQILGGLALSAVARFADGLVVLFAAQMVDVQLAIPTAVFVLAVSGLAGGVSFLPAGTGAVETTMTGLLVLFGTPWTDALAITLLARLGTLWLWVALGLALAFVLKLRPLPAAVREDSGL